MNARWMLVLLAAGVVACTSAEERLADAHTALDSALATGDPAGVEQAAAGLRALAEENPGLLPEIAPLLVAAGDAPRAAWALEGAVRAAPGRDDLRLLLAHTALVLGDAALASEAVAAIGEDSPHDLDATLLRARIALELGDLEGGLAQLDAAQDRHPLAPEAALFRIATLLHEQQLEEASQAIEDARETGAIPDDGTLDLIAARVELASGHPDAAIAHIDRHLARHPDDLAAVSLVAEALAREGRHDDARARARAGRESDPARAEWLALAAQVELRAGDEAGALAWLEAYAETGASSQAVLLLARYHTERNDPDSAAQVLHDGLLRHPDVPRLRMALAESLIDTDRIDAARHELARFRTAAPGDPHAEYLAARLDLAEGDVQGAIARLRALLPRLDRAYTQFWLGRALEAEGDLDGARRRYGLAALRDTTSPAAPIALLQLAEARADWAAVAGHALTLVDRVPGRREGYETTVTASVRAGDANGALRIAGLYRERFPADAAPIALQAFVLRAQGRLDEAETLLASGQALHGDAPDLVAEEALLLDRRGRTQEGIGRLGEALRSHPDSARLHATLAALRFRLGDAPGGAAATERALELDPEDLAPLKLRARFYAASDQPEHALADCDRFRASRRLDAEVAFMRAVLLSTLGRDDEAVLAYRQTVALDPRAYAARNNLALLLEADGRRDEALTVAQEAYALAETHPDVVDTLGWLYLRRGLVPRAVALLERAHAAAPESARTQLHLAQAYAADGRPRDARVLLDDLLTRDDVEPAIVSEADETLQALER